jgi:hypothetical protein
MTIISPFTASGAGFTFLDTGARARSMGELTAALRAALPHLYVLDHVLHQFWSPPPCLILQSLQYVAGNELST